MRGAGHGPYRPEAAGKRSGRCNAQGRRAQIAKGLKGNGEWGRDGSRVRIIWIKWVGTHKDHDRTRATEVDHGD
jgi:hypothetical protein